MNSMAVMKREFAFRERDFRFLSDFLEQRTGIILADNKRELVYGRIARRVRAKGFTRFRDYCDFLETAEGGKEIIHTIDAVTTNTTSFFRESHHFDFLGNKIFPELATCLQQDQNQHYRIWSAGCSSGEEAYSLAMTLKEAIPDMPRNCKILATDISVAMLEKAHKGHFSPVGNRGEEITQRIAAFLRPSNKDNIFEIDPAIRSLITFKKLNLMQDWPMRGKFDIIFCRNVMIYFGRNIQDILVRRFADILKPGGLLMIGHSENLLRAEDVFENLGQTIYRKRP